MKINVNYAELLGAIDSLKKGLELTGDERSLLLELVNACEGDYYPSKDELAEQMSRLSKLDSIEDPDSPLFQHLIKRCSEFENKYL